jgi:hypothetical protein
VTASFESPVIVPSNTTIRVVTNETCSSDSASNAYELLLATGRSS